MTRNKETSSLADEELFANVLYYGQPKSGKTTAAASVAKLGDTVYIDAEAGLKSGPLMEFGVPVASIEPFREIDFDSLLKLFWDLNDDPPVALVWDSLSESMKKLLFATAQRRYERKPTNERYAIELGDYGINTNEMRELTRKFRDLRCHTAFVALEKREQDENTSAVSYGPDMTSKFASDVLGYVDVICHTYTVDVKGSDEPEYWGAFRTFDLHVGGDRFHLLPSKLITPSMDRIIGYLNGTLTIEDDELMNAWRERGGLDVSKAATPNGEALLVTELGATEVDSSEPANAAKPAGRRRPPPKPAVAS